MDHVILICEGCGAKFKVPKKKLPQKEVVTKCSKCQGRINIPSQSLFENGEGCALKATLQDTLDSANTKSASKSERQDVSKRKGALSPQQTNKKQSPPESSPSSDKNGKAARRMSELDAETEINRNGVAIAKVMEIIIKLGKYVEKLLAQFSSDIREHGHSSRLLTMNRRSFIGVAIVIVIGALMFWVNSSGNTPPDHFLDAKIVMRSGIIEIDVTPRNMAKALEEAAARSTKVTTSGWEKIPKGYRYKAHVSEQGFGRFNLDYYGDPDSDSYVFMVINGQAFLGTRQSFMLLWGITSSINGAYHTKEALQKLSYDDLQFEYPDPNKYAPPDSKVNRSSKIFDKISSYPKTKFGERK